MLGAIAGDIIGSVYKARPIKTTRFRLFTPSLAGSPTTRCSHGRTCLTA